MSPNWVLCSMCGQSANRNHSGAALTTAASLKRYKVSVISTRTSWAPFAQQVCPCWARGALLNEKSVFWSLCLDQGHESDWTQTPDKTARISFLLQSFVVVVVFCSQVSQVFPVKTFVRLTLAFSHCIFLHLHIYWGQKGYLKWFIFPSRWHYSYQDLFIKYHIQNGWKIFCLYYIDKHSKQETYTDRGQQHYATLIRRKVKDWNMFLLQIIPIHPL